MKKIILKLDNKNKYKNYNNQKLNQNLMNKKLNLNKINTIVIGNNYDYYKNFTDPFINLTFNSLNYNKSIIIEPSEYNVFNEIESLSDLILIINQYQTISNITKNKHLESLLKVKDPLVSLNNLIGMKELKNDILDQILFYVQNLHVKNGMEYMHTVLCGPPGTGKTEVAKIIGTIFAQLGILKKNTFTKVVRADLIAGYLGQTAIKTSKVIENSLGGVLFIDEAYALGNEEKRDSFAKECIDTLCEGLSNHKDNLMVIIAGYENELNNCFFNYNSGLRSRFPWVFKTDKYTAEDLMLIFNKKIKEISWKLDHTVSINFFKENIKNLVNFGRDIELLISKTKICHGRRVFGLSEDLKTIITKEDLENGMKLFKKHTTIPNNTNFMSHLYN